MADTRRGEVCQKDHSHPKRVVCCDPISCFRIFGVRSSSSNAPRGRERFHGPAPRTSWQFPMGPCLSLQVPTAARLSTRSRTSHCEKLQLVLSGGRLVGGVEPLHGTLELRN